MQWMEAGWVPLLSSERMLPDTVSNTRIRVPLVLAVASLVPEVINKITNLATLKNGRFTVFCTLNQFNQILVKKSEKSTKTGTMSDLIW